MSKEKRRGELTLKALNLSAIIRETNADHYISWYEEQEQGFEAVSKANFYFYVADTDSVERYALEPDYFKIFYGNVASAFNEFTQATEKLSREIVQIVQDGTPVYQANCREIMGSSFQLMRSAGTLEGATPSPFKGFSYISEVQKFRMMQFFNQVGVKKSEAFRETIRRFIPRFITHPINIEGAEELAKWWATGLVAEEGGAASKYQRILIAPNQALSGRLPLNEWFRLAEELKGQDKGDLGYRIRTEAVIKLLKMEQERATPEYGQEMQFFYYLFAAITAGNVVKEANPVYFDFQGEIKKLWFQTFKKMVAEINSGQISEAGDFMEQLVEIYGQGILPALAFSLSKFQQFNEVDARVITRFLSRAPEQTWEHYLLLELVKQKGRRMMYVHEADEALALLSRNATGMENLPPIDLLAGKLVEEADSYSFTYFINNSGGGQRLALVIETDRFSQTLKVNIRHFNNGDYLFLPIEVPLAADPNPVETMLDGEIQIWKRPEFQSVINRILYEQTEKLVKTVAPKSKPRKPKLNKKSEGSAEPDHQEVGTKRRHQFSQEQAEVNESAAVLEIDNSVDRQFVGLSQTSVEQLLNEAKIEGIEPQWLIEKLELMLHYAEISKLMLGKKVRMYTRKSKAEGINLRQLNFVLDGGNRALRVYVEDIGGGQFMLRGIMVKKGYQMQQRYIDRLVARIAKSSSRG